MLTSVIATCVQAGVNALGVSGRGPGTPPGGVCQSPRVAAVELSGRPRALVRDGSPGGGELGAVGMAVP